MTALPDLRELLEPGERLLWSDRPSYPRPLRLLGLPPRRPAHVFWLALVITGAAGCLLAGLRLELAPAARAALLAAGGLPSVWLGAWASWAAWRHRRVRYALTDRGRVLLQEGTRLRALPLPAAAELQSDPEGAFGRLELGEGVALVDLPYPAALRPILAACRAGLSAAAPPSGADPAPPAGEPPG